MSSLEKPGTGTDAGDDSAARFVLALGSALALAGVGHVYVDPEPVAVRAIELLIVGLPAAGILYGGYWLASRRVLAEDRWAVATWAVAGSAIGAVLVGGWLGSERLAGNSVPDGYLIFLVGTSVGGLVGVLATGTTRQSVSGSEADEDRGPPAFESPPDIDTFATVAVDPRLWYALQAVHAADGPVAVERITRELGCVESAGEDERYLDLVHIRLPKLESCGLVRYDPATKVVRATERGVAVLAAGEELAQ